MSKIRQVIWTNPLNCGKSNARLAVPHKPDPCATSDRSYCQASELHVIPPGYPKKRKSRRASVADAVFSLSGKVSRTRGYAFSRHRLLRFLDHIQQPGRESHLMYSPRVAVHLCLNISRVCFREIEFDSADQRALTRYGVCLCTSTTINIRDTTPRVFQRGLEQWCTRQVPRSKDDWPSRRSKTTRVLIQGAHDKQGRETLEL